MSQILSDRSAAVNAALAHIERDRHFNAWSHLDREGALSAAKESTAWLAAGQAPRALEGELIAIKANIAVRGWPYDGGLPVRRGIFADEDAAVITRLRAAGAILLGQTCMDAGALGAEGRSTDGPIRNPRRPTHSAGGSSGGSAAAVAAGHVDFALGTDTIGSVRIPAAYCGVSSLKPSASRISLAGVLPLHEHFDHVGPITARAQQLETLWRVLADDSLSDPASLSEPWRGLRIGFVSDAAALRATSAVLHHYECGLQRLRTLGAQLESVAIVPLDPGKVRRAIFALCERAIWLQHRQSLQLEPQKYSPVLTAMLHYGGSLSDSKVATLMTQIKDFAHQLQARMQGLQALVMPTSPGQAFDFEGPTPLDNADLTAIATAAGLPAASVPLPTGDHLPVGLQIVAPMGEDSFACRLAAAFEIGAR